MTDLRIEELVKRYGDVRALDGVSLRLADDEFHALVGPNGSGKTTLLRTVLGLTPPTAGRVVVPDDLTVGCAFQSPSFYPSLTVAENLDVFGSFVGSDPDWVASVTDRLALDPVRDRVAAELSGGYARKLDLALAVAREPDLLLLDEPLGALDAVTKRRLVAFLSEYADGHGVVVSTHDLDAFGDALDRLTVLADGRLRASTAAGDDPRARYLAELDREPEKRL